MFLVEHKTAVHSRVACHPQFYEDTYLIKHHLPRNVLCRDAFKDLHDKAPRDIRLEGQGVGALAIRVIQLSLPFEALCNGGVLVVGHWDDLEEVHVMQVLWAQGLRECGGSAHGHEEEIAVGVCTGVVAVCLDELHILRLQGHLWEGQRL